MTTDQELLHVTFGHSAAGSLRQALTLAGRKERVLVEPDDLGYGPIAAHDAARRGEFLEQRLGFTDEDRLVEQVAAFWQEVSSTSATLVAWISRRSVREYAGFHALAAHRAVSPWFVDVADVAFVGRDGLPRPDTSKAFAWVRHDEVIAHDLLRAARPLSDDELTRIRSSWKKLQAEDAELRVLDTTGLRSVPITFFDDVVASCVTTDWQRCARVVGDAAFRCDGGPFRQCDDLFVWSRLLALIDDGVFEGRGDLCSMHESSVRRSRSAAR